MNLWIGNCFFFIGSQVLAKIVKNKHAPPFRNAQFELKFGNGICRESEIIELGIKHNFVTKIGGAFYSLNGQSFCGKDGIKEFLASNESAREELKMKLREKLQDSWREQKKSEMEEVGEDPVEDSLWAISTSPIDWLFQEHQLMGCFKSAT